MQGKSTGIIQNADGWGSPRLPSLLPEALHASIQSSRRILPLGLKMTSATPHDLRNPVLPDPAALAQAWKQKAQEGWWADPNVPGDLARDPAPIYRALSGEIAGLLQTPLILARRISTPYTRSWRRSRRRSLPKRAPPSRIEAYELARVMLDAVLRDISVMGRPGR